MDDLEKKQSDEDLKKDLFSAFTLFDGAAGEPDGKITAEKLKATCRTLLVLHRLQFLLLTNTALLFYLIVSFAVNYFLKRFVYVNNFSIVSQNQSFTDDELDAMICALDFDDSHTIEFGEFLNLMDPKSKAYTMMVTLLNLTFPLSIFVFSLLSPRLLP